METTTTRYNKNAFPHHSFLFYAKTISFAFPQMCKRYLMFRDANILEISIAFIHTGVPSEAWTIYILDQVCCISCCITLNKYRSNSIYDVPSCHSRIHSSLHRSVDTSAIIITWLIGNEYSIQRFFWLFFGNSLFSFNYICAMSLSHLLSL